MRARHRSRSGVRRSTPGSTVRAVRGAVQVERDDADLVIAETTVLLTELVRRNGLAADDLISLIFTTTPDLVSCFPATAARRLGLTAVPLLCATEIDVPGALPGVVRLLAHVRTHRPAAALHHVYLRGAERLRPDLAGTWNAWPTGADPATG